MIVYKYDKKERKEKKRNYSVRMNTPNDVINIQ